MLIPLAQAELKSGEQMVIGRIDGPSSSWRPRLLDFLDHKGEEWLAHLDLALTDRLDNLHTHFYVGVLSGQKEPEPVCHIMVSEASGVGLLGHVYTHPDHRQKGAIRELMRKVMADSESVGVEVMTLSTGFDSPPYHIYRSFGFDSIVEGDGNMICNQSRVDTLLRPGTTEIRKLRWEDWPSINLIALLPDDDRGDAVDPRSVALGIFSRGSVEGPFIRFQLARAQQPDIDGVALVTAQGIAMGWSTIAPVTVDGRVEWVVDAYAAPGFEEHYPRLIDGLRQPDRRVTAYYRSAGPRVEALRNAGFMEDAEADRRLTRMSGFEEITPITHDA